MARRSKFRVSPTPIPAKYSVSTYSAISNFYKTKTQTPKVSGLLQLNIVGGVYIESNEGGRKQKNSDTWSARLWTLPVTCRWVRSSLSVITTLWGNVVSSTDSIHTNYKERSLKRTEYLKQVLLLIVNVWEMQLSKEVGLCTQAQQTLRPNS